MSDNFRAHVTDAKNKTILSADLNGAMEDLLVEVMTKNFTDPAMMPALDERLKPIVEKVKAGNGSMRLMEINQEIQKVVTQEELISYLRDLYRDSLIETFQKWILPLAEKAADEILEDGLDGFIQGQASGLPTAMAAVVLEAASKSA